MAYFDLDILRRSASSQVDVGAWNEFSNIIARLNSEWLVFSAKECLLKSLRQFLIFYFSSKTLTQQTAGSSQIADTGNSLVHTSPNAGNKVIRLVVGSVVSLLSTLVDAPLLVVIEVYIALAEIMLASSNASLVEVESRSELVSEAFFRVVYQLLVHVGFTAPEMVCHPDAASMLKMYANRRERLMVILLSLIISVAPWASIQDRGESEKNSTVKADLFQILICLFYAGKEATLSMSRATKNPSSSQLALSALSSLIPPALHITNLHDGYLWHATLRKVNCEVVLISAIQELMNRQLSDNLQADFSKWPEPKDLMKNGNIKLSSPSSGICRLPLLDCFDIARNLVLSGVLPNQTRFSAAVIDVANGSTCLTSFRDTLASQPSSKASAYMGCNSVHGGMSDAAMIWSKCLEFNFAVLASCRVIDAQDLVTLVSPLSRFMQTYASLILLPFAQGIGPYTSQSLDLARYSSAMVADILRFPLCVSILTTVTLSTLTSIAGKTLVTFAGIVGDGTESAFLNHQRLLLSCSVDVTSRILYK